MAEVIPYRFKLRGGTAAEWTAANPVLLEREPGIETDTGAIKIGNGVADWRSLPYSGRNTQQLLNEARQETVNQITALDIPTLRNKVDTMWANQGGEVVQPYDDTQLRTDMATRDSNTLASANTYTDQRETSIRSAIPTDTVTSAQLSSYALVSNTATKQEVADAESRANTYANNAVSPIASRVTTLEGRPRSVVLSQTQYNALASKDASTLYFITA
jgi:hypothetical protein